VTPENRINPEAVAQFEEPGCACLSGSLLRTDGNSRSMIGESSGCASGADDAVVASPIYGDKYNIREAWVYVMTANRCC